MKTKVIDTLQTWMVNAGMSQADIARHTHKTTGAISLVFSGQRNPSIELIVDIAKACGKPPEEALRLAGLLPPVPPETSKKDELSYIVNQLPEQEVDDLIQYARLRLQISEKRGEYKTK